MKIKQIEITFNDDTKQSDIDYQVARISELLEAQGITAVILVHEVEEPDILTHDEQGQLIHLLDKPDLYEHG